MKYTKGKWRVQGYPRLTIQSEQGEICLINPNIDEDKDNAKLISKAPEMYEALKNGAEVLEKRGNGNLTLSELEMLKSYKSILKEIKS